MASGTAGKSVPRMTPGFSGRHPPSVSVSTQLRRFVPIRNRYALSKLYNPMKAVTTGQILCQDLRTSPRPDRYPGRGARGQVQGHRRPDARAKARCPSGSGSSGRGTSSLPVCEARKIFANAQMGPREVKAFCRIGPEGERLLEVAVTKLGFSARAYDRSLKVARTDRRPRGGCGYFPGAFKRGHPVSGDGQVLLIPFIGII